MLNSHYFFMLQLSAVCCQSSAFLFFNYVNFMKNVQLFFINKRKIKRKMLNNHSILRTFTNYIRETSRKIRLF